MIKTIIKIILGLFGLFVIVIISGGIYLTRGLKEVNNLTVSNVNLNTIDDGEYIGEYKGYRWNTKVKVTVENHKIVNIEVLEDQVFKRDEVTNEILERVIKEQSIEVDAVSSATVSSNAYLKAIEDALSNK